MNSTTITKTSELLIEAKKRLSTTRKETIHWGNSLYVCIAISLAAAANYSTKADVLARKVSNRIRESLGEYSSVRNWLANVAMVPYEELNEEAMQQYRHRWIDSLIAEYQAAGD